MKFNVEVRIKLKKGMLNPEAATIQRALALLGYEVENTNTIDIITFTMEEDNKKKVEEEVEDMCQRLLCNPVIHDYQINIKPED
ncbi:MAG TPA: phosphoribosylformylglycinamidine synthase subunit PurS [Methanothermobacter sp.]|uniref:Phosphoribosylformylglycinamidine synthase subunit PurS n=1 Tax=Methanothermobacter tenebrarum TaxID=680118 RepID=A0ABN6PB54_9EURY|nr:phosphoribosylformylglycinamidine synthase subunit PurS [Methanothermobacter tenebrarum]MDI6881583.1 phosphoribosylformylglycinamidine synthase subunit PurS [Methanothermobacter sp.]BDH79445.1 phosphoribosylformylglycinamidine synthase [Methanothermobacter tenebrarum]HHW16033.1 phosphoribosylformylglycinamidine synthase subunit PurS [Methanothermobacter sp.]HOQ19467.1 phosphoribosylformylglycinamidine synthase subunit PurS [Methanothermobacter sp.]